MTMPSSSKGLVSTRVILERLQVSSATLDRWQELGFITPAHKSQKGNLWVLPQPHHVAEIRRQVAQHRRALCQKGAAVNHASGAAQRGIAKSHEQMRLDPTWRNRATQTSAKKASEGAPDGYITEIELSVMTGVPKATLTRWRISGIITDFVKVGRLVRCRPLTPEEVARIREECLRKQREQGTLNAPKLYRNRPEGCLDFKECAVATGVSVGTIRSAVADGGLPHLRTGRWVWIFETDLACWSEGRSLVAERLAKEQETKSATARCVAAPPPRPKALEIPRPQPREEIKPPAKTIVVPVDGLPYEEALAAGKADPRFQGPLGFNLLRQGEHFRPVPVNEAPAFPWRWYQRHHKNGFGNWQMRTMNPATGEVHL